MVDRKGIDIGEEIARAAGVPDDLDASAAGEHTVPDTRRRRLVAVTLLVGGAAGASAVWLGLPAGMLAAAAALLVGAGWAWLSAWPLRVGVEQALEAANREAGFAVGHASAAVGFTGWRSRPVWNVLVFSADDPPTRRGLVRVDGVTGMVVGSYAEEIPGV